jgi:hypothetical protein
MMNFGSPGSRQKEQNNCTPSLKWWWFKIKV